MNSKLKYKFYRFMCNLIFGNTKDLYISKKNKYKNILFSLVLMLCNRLNITGENNVYDIKKIIANNIELIINGSNNVVKLEFDNIKGFGNKYLRIHIYGDNNVVSIGENLKVHEYLSIDLAYPPNKTNNSKVIIGNNFGVGNMEIMLLEDSSECTIGDNCMFSQFIIIRLSDTHSILDLEGNLLNYGGKVNIGNHVWCGREVRILKKVSIGDNSIIGASSVVTKKFEENNVIVAGNPAKIVKRGIKWTYHTPNKYCALEREKEGSSF